MNGIFCHALAFSLVTTLGCSGGNDDPVGTPALLWCEGLCSATRRCGDPRNPEECLDACVRERPGLASFSTRGAELVGSCIASFGCGTLYDEAAWKAGLNDCWERALTMVEPTPHVRSLCPKILQADFECGYSQVSTDDCERAYGLQADEVIDRVAACTERPTCTQFNACVELVFKTP